MSSFSPSSQALLVSLVLCASSILFACGDDGGAAATDAGEEPSYTVGGTVTGLTGELNLVLNGTEHVAVSSADGGG